VPSAVILLPRQQGPPTTVSKVLLTSPIPALGASGQVVPMTCLRCHPRQKAGRKATR